MTCAPVHMKCKRAVSERHAAVVRRLVSAHGFERTRAMLACGEVTLRDLVSGGRVMPATASRLETLIDEMEAAEGGLDESRLS